MQQWDISYIWNTIKCSSGHAYGLIVISIFYAYLRFSDCLETSNMKPFAISESHLTLSDVSMREQGQRRSETAPEARKESRRSP